MHRVNCYTSINTEWEQRLINFGREFQFCCQKCKIILAEEKDTLKVFWKKHANYLILNHSLEAILIFFILFPTITHKVESDDQFLKLFLTLFGVYNVHVVLAEGQLHLHQAVYISLALPLIFFKSTNIILIQFLTNCNIFQNSLNSSFWSSTPCLCWHLRGGRGELCVRLRLCSPSTPVRVSRTSGSASPSSPRTAAREITAWTSVSIHAKSWKGTRLGLPSFQLCSSGLPVRTLCVLDPAGSSGPEPSVSCGVSSLAQVPSLTSLKSVLWNALLFILQFFQ